MKLSEELPKPQDASLQNLLLYPVNHGTCLLNIDGLYLVNGEWLECWAQTREVHVLVLPFAWTPAGCLWANQVPKVALDTITSS